MAKSTHAPRGARSHKPAAGLDAVEKPSKAPKGTVRIFPTHRRQAGPLVVGLPSVDGNSDELVIDDAGADVNEALAEQLIAAREATTDAPAAAEE